METPDDSRSDSDASTHWGGVGGYVRASNQRDIVLNAMMTTRRVCQSCISRLLIVTSGRRARPMYLLAVALMCLLLLQMRQIKNIFGGSDDESIGGDIFEFCKTVDVAKDETSPLLFVYWTTVFLKKDWGFGADLEQCPRLKDKCIFTTNQSLHCSADVMLLHMRDPFEVTLHRPPHQKWVFGLMESPVYTEVNLNAIRSLFNVTMTYKRTSNIPWLYGRCVSLPPPHDANTMPAATNFAAGKMHVAAWFVSNCNPQSKRQVYVERLMEYMDVHVYGQCGGAYDCPKQDEELCMARVNYEYKFIFAFENSLCEDYVTEKVWQIMQRQLNVVLVVLGRTKYAEVLPPHSFIDVSDYSSPESLAKYLMRLDADDALYNEYFRWRTSYDCTGNGPPMGCQVCDYMLRHRGEQQTVDVQQFWSFETNCIQPERFYAGWQQISAGAASIRYFDVLVLIIASLRLLLADNIFSSS